MGSLLYVMNPARVSFITDGDHRMSERSREVDVSSRDIP